MTGPAKKKRRESAADVPSAAQPAEQQGAGGVGKDLIAKSTGGLTQAERGSAVSPRAHRRGYDPDEQVTSLAHVYSPWANVRANGSGIVALAAWAKRLEEEAAEGASSALSASADFVRGLTHR